MYLIFKVDFRDDCFWEENDWSIVLVPVTISMFLYFDAAAAAKLLHSCPTLCDPIDEPTRLCCPWDSPGKNTGVGCHFLLQCMKVKSESEVTQSCPTLSDPMDCSLPGSSIHGIFQARCFIIRSFTSNGNPSPKQAAMYPFYREANRLTRKMTEQDFKSHLSVSKIHVKLKFPTPFPSYLHP